MNTYEIHVVPKRPAFNDTGHNFGVNAKTWREAMSKGRKVARNIGFYDRHDGALIFTCKRVD